MGFADSPVAIIKTDGRTQWTLQLQIHKSVSVQLTSISSQLTEGRDSLKAVMSSIVDYLFFMVSVVEFIIGNFGNGFIVLINSIDWIKNRMISMIDFILTCLAISRISLLWTTISCISINIIDKRLFHSTSLRMSFDLLWTGSNYLCFACTTCLSVFYFLKIARFSNLVFLWLKRRIHKVLLIIVLGAILYFCIFLISMESVTKNIIEELIKAEKNLTLNLMGALYDFFIHHIFLNLILLMFFGVALASFLFLVLSLRSHTWQMKLQGIYSRDSSTQTHIRAMKTMISFLVLFIVHYFSKFMVLMAYSILATAVAKNFAHVLLFL
jgi:taste receptor type 2